MKRKNFNMIASATAFALGAIYLFSDGASITANVIGSSGSGAGFASIIGIAMIIGSMILFEVSMNNADTQSIDLERLIRRTRDHEEMYNSEKVKAEPSVEIRKTHHEQHAHSADHIHDKKKE
jgi:ABC-type nickel/cobalt efflux system permease component RcnA